MIKCIRALLNNNTILKTFDLCEHQPHITVNILIVTESLNPTYFLYFDIPLKLLHLKQKVNYAVVSESTLTQTKHRSINLLKQFKPDILVLSRVSHPIISSLIASAKKKGIPIIYQIDDDLLHLHNSLGKKVLEKHGHPDVLNRRRNFLLAADLIYASTNRLSESLKRIFPNKRIYAGISVPYMKHCMPQHIYSASKDKNPIIGYMGSKGHQSDLALVLPDIIKILDKRSNVRFELFGSIKMPSELSRYKSRIQHHKPVSYYVFLETLNQLNWSIGLAPLIEHPFNLAKSPVKYLEYTACHIPVIATDTPVYNQVIPKNGGLLVKRGWYDAMEYFLFSRNERERAIRVADSHCETAFDETRYAEQLLSIFRSLI